jgi:hypothetical protein
VVQKLNYLLFSKDQGKIESSLLQNILQKDLLLEVVSDHNV